jgi:hypothetical protein
VETATSASGGTLGLASALANLGVLVRFSPFLLQSSQKDCAKRRQSGKAAASPTQFSSKRITLLGRNLRGPIRLRAMSFLEEGHHVCEQFQQPL